MNYLSVFVIRFEWTISWHIWVLTYQLHII
jgi:hypothetical protein